MHKDQGETHILENWFPLFPRTNGIRPTHHQALGVDTEVPAIPRLQGYPGKKKKNVSVWEPFVLN